MAYISGINTATPDPDAQLGDGDDEIRQLKSDIKTSFPNIDGPVTVTPTELNILLGETDNTIHNSSLIPAATRAIFPQPNAPTGWTIDGSINNRALRVIGTEGIASSGGSLDFLDVFSATKQSETAGSHDHGGDTDDHELTIAQIPAHNHTVGWSQTAEAGTTRRQVDNSPGIGGDASSGDTGGGGVHSHGIQSQSGHEHTVALNIKYVDSIICTKDAY